ncbi:MAG: hypothetical protein ACJAZN_000745 [Planctomycetota bacterium]|jgi:hypothetical protein
MGYVLGQMKHTTRSGNERGRIKAGLVLPLIVAGAALSWATLRAEEPAARGLGAAAGQGEQEPGGPQDPGGPRDEVEAAEAALQAAFTAAGVLVDRAAAAVAIPVSAEVRSEYLEYVLVNPHGAVHEALFVTPVNAQVLGTAFLSVGAEAGKNVEYIPLDPPPTPAEARAGAKTHDTIPPSGKPLYLYVTWKEHAGVPDLVTGEYPNETLHFHRLEDLIVDLQRDRTLRRHGWVWLGSRILPPAKDGGAERFAADVTGNLACVSFFPQGDTLLTPAQPECESQTSWIANRWLLPAPGAQMLMIGSSNVLAGVPDAFADAVPLIPVDAADPRSLVDDTSAAQDD